MNKSTLNVLLPLLLTSLIWFAIGWYGHMILFGQTSTSPAEERILKAYDLLLNYQYAGPETTADITPDMNRPDAYSEAAIDGMLTYSQDNHADLYGPAAAARYEEDIQGLTGVPGYWFDIVDDQMVVTEVQNGTPAATAGIQVGDILLSANGFRFTKNNIGNEASFLQRGPVGSTLNLQVQRDDEVLDFALPLQEQHFVKSKIVGNQLGYLDVNLFVQGIDNDVEQELTALLNQGIKGLIWDLRRNDGGSVEETQSILSYFIAEGPLYIVEFRDGTQRIFEAESGAFVPEMPIVILVDQFTNSSAELATIAMIEHRHAYVIGTTTAGKGSIQDTVRLDDNYLMHYTVAHWLTPSEQSIEKVGIVPDKLIEDDPATTIDEPLEAAISFLQE